MPITKSAAQVRAEELGAMLRSMPPLVTSKQLAELTGEHIGSIRRGIAEGRIPADKINGRWFIPAAFLLENTFAYIEAVERGEGGPR